MEEKIDKEGKEQMIREIGGGSVRNGVKKVNVIVSERESGQQSLQWYEGKRDKRGTKFWNILFQSSLWEPE